MTELTLLCTFCRQPVADYDGYLYISFTAIRDYDTGMEEWRARQASGPCAAVDLAELLTMPGRAPWTVIHNRCDERLDFIDGYYITPERIRTWTALAHWTAHLMAKRWLASTDWDQLLFEAAGESTVPRIVAVKSVAA